ncbi:MAG: transposase, partial [Gammaproteobacteria bacterium]|nr:transposase [Gammaproteobacteria bacterium]
PAAWPQPARVLNALLWAFLDPFQCRKSAFSLTESGPVFSRRSFTSLDHARGVIETWRREYNDARPKKTLGGLTPTEYAKQISQKADTLTVSL